MFTFISGPTGTLFSLDCDKDESDNWTKKTAVHTWGLVTFKAQYQWNSINLCGRYFNVSQVSYSSETNFAFIAFKANILSLLVGVGINQHKSMRVLHFILHT